MPTNYDIKKSYKLSTVARWEAHFISRVTFVKEVGFPEHKIKERFD